MQIDRLYYWQGGTEEGRWRMAWPTDLDAGRQDIEHMGYVCVRGSEAIGPPEGPPSLERINQVLKPYR